VKHARSRDELLRRLDAGEIVPLDTDRWRDWSEAFVLKDEVPTTIAGTIRVVRWPATGRARGWAVVEEPGPRERVVRPLPDRAAVKALIAERLAAYERMWDG
jgi:hypothetical protein